MGKGKKMSKTGDGRSGEAPETCRSNENKPKMNGDLGHGGQSKIDSYMTPAKTPSARPPLQEENSTPFHEGKDMRKASSGTRKKAEVPESERPSTATDDKDRESSVSDSAQGQKQTLTAEPQKKLPPADRKPEPHRMVKAKSNRRKVHVTKSPNRKVTDYFQVRRSFRKNKTELESEEKKRIDDLITSGKEEGMKIDIITGKGRGVIATRDFCRGEFVVEYYGDLIEITDAKKREAAYARDDSTGCYMYYFQFQNKTYCVDATKETNRLGRLINHSKSGNCHTKLHNIKNLPHLILVASRDISAGEELLYDYGDRSKSSIEAHPWLKN
ncbi:PREDICTED: N-lysine methyltransferase KMT5A [Nanorana parkeri]|uniref:N-lysine methyltransferase KMT5A n=1 Tax=Nanorana parkeri TaxID=125878 RepID=UPI0008541C11|nr:PREDICTED: N-lysine methyltransferase KMT5A [Nanorana parkeri]